MDNGDSHGERPVEQPSFLASSNDAARPSQNSDVVTEQGHRTAIDVAVPANLAVAGSGSPRLRTQRSAKGPDLPERSVIDEPVNMLAHRTVALGSHLGDLVRASHLGTDDIGTSMQIGHPVLM